MYCIKGKTIDYQLMFFALENGEEKFECQLILVWLLYQFFPLKQGSKGSCWKTLWWFTAIFWWFFSSSKITCSISTISFWKLKWNGAPLALKISCFKANKSLVEFFFIAMLRLIGCNMRDGKFGSDSVPGLRHNQHSKCCPYWRNQDTKLKFFLKNIFISFLKFSPYKKYN